MKHALLDGNSVVRTLELSEGLNPEDFAPSTSGWFEVPDEVGPRWIRGEGGKFAPPSCVETTPTPAALKAYAARARYDRETGGIKVAGRLIATDRESRTLVEEATRHAHETENKKVRFKTRTGFHDLSATQMDHVATAVRAHVQDAFAREADAHAGIDGGVIATLTDIDKLFD